PGGSVEHMNQEAGAVWLQRVLHTYPACVWLNPEAERAWDYSRSNVMIRELFNGRMYPLTLEGLDDAMRELSRKHG
ncbi:MAG: VWA domain-containing protein, partial [Novosphingobium sp.]|nr:VWA domain-containing protein [Novosphingobium sp.]